MSVCTYDTLLSWLELIRPGTCYLLAVISGPLPAEIRARIFLGIPGSEDS